MGSRARTWIWRLPDSDRPSLGIETFDRTGEGARRSRRRSLFILIALGLAALLGCRHVQELRSEAHAATVEDAEARFRSALAAGDVDALDRLLSEDFLYLTADGTTLDKNGLLDHLRSGATRVDRIVQEDHRQLRREGLVVTTGHSLVDARLEGEAIRVRSRHLHVWVENPGGWQLLAREADMQVLKGD